MKHILDIEKGQCRYPVGADPRGHLFCGEPVRDEKCSYCAAHADIAFTGLLAAAPRGHGRPGGNPELKPGRIRVVAPEYTI